MEAVHVPFGGYAKFGVYLVLKVDIFRIYSSHEYQDNRAR